MDSLAHAIQNKDGGKALLKQLTDLEVPESIKIQLVDSICGVFGVEVESGVMSPSWIRSEHAFITWEGLFAASIGLTENTHLVRRLMRMFAGSSQDML